MFSRLIHSLRARLLIMLLLSLLPVVGLTFFMGNQELAREKTQAFEDARRLALLTASNCKTLLDTGQRLLAGVAASPCAAQFKKESCDGLMTRVLSSYSEYTRFALLDSSGQPLSSSVSEKPNMAVEARSWVRKLMDSGKTSLVESGPCPLTGRPSIVMLYKVNDSSGVLCSVVLMSLDLKWFDNLASGFAPHPDATISLIDRQGRFLARYPDDAAFAGRSIPETERVMQGLLEKKGDAWELAGVDMQSRIYAFAPVVDTPGAEIFARIGLPSRAAYHEAYRTFTRNLYLLGAMSLLILAGAAVFAQLFVLGQARRIGEAARKLSAGELDFRLGMQDEKGELAEVGQAFDTMADSIEKSTRLLSQAEENFRTLVDNVNVGIFRCLMSFPPKFMNVNPTLVRMLEFPSPEAMTSQRPEEIFSRVATLKGPNLWQAILAGRLNSIEAVFAAPSGRKLYLIINLTKERRPSGEGQLLDGVVEDISALKEAERQLKLAVEAQSRAARLKGEFLSLVTHEMRTPLTSISGFAKIISKKLEKTVFPALPNTPGQIERVRNQVLKDLAIVVEEGLRLSSFVDEVLDLATLESGEAEFNIAPCSICEILDEIAAAHLPACQAKGLSLIYEPCSAPISLNCDNKRIRQVLNHLFSNALKFTREGSLTLKSETRDGEIVISLRDTGLGIPEQHWKNIFHNFEQLGDQLTDKPAGMGIGLSICKKIAERHGGRIWLDSELGKGSIFFLVLPLPS